MAVTSGDAVREADQFLLGPGDRQPEPVKRDPHGVQYNRDLRAWTIFSPLGSLIALQLRQPDRGGPRDDGQVVAAATSQLKGEGAADVSGTEYSDAEP